MRRYVIITFLGVVWSGVAFSQMKKHFYLEKDNSFEKIDFEFSLPSGTCYISPKSGANPLSIYSNQDLEHYDHRFGKWEEGNNIHVSVNLDSKDSEEYNETISYKLLSSSEKEDNHIWKIYLSDENPYDLNLNYGIGEAFVDLSGLAINKLKVHSGSANVNVGFLNGEGNQVVMDTFSVKVDLGTIKVRNMDLTNAKLVNADVGFGNLYLDYSKGVEIKSQVNASVGAGDLVVSIPSLETPVIVKVKSSLLCRVRLTKHFKEIKNDVYVNDIYHPDADNLLTFNVDVSMGNIIFKVK